MSNHFKYPVRIEKDDNNTLLVTFPDIPEAITFGETLEDAFERAIDCLDTALAFRIKEGQALPKSSYTTGKCVSPSPLVALKAALFCEMKKQGIRKSDLVKKLKCSPKTVDRIVDARHKSTFKQMESAFRVIGKHIIIHIESAA